MSGLDDTSFTYRAVTAATTLTNNDFILAVSPSGGNVTVTVPDGTKVQPGRVYYVRRDATATNTVTLAPAAGLIDGASTKAVGSAGAIGYLAIVNDGTNWVSFQ